jgi:cellulose synthase (UDP-forming)
MVLALAGGVLAFAPGQHFPLASQVQGTFLSFRILPTVVKTFLWPFGHPFKVTPKGGTSQASSYALGIFWTSASLIGLTILGLIINTIPEWRIVENADVLPVVAFWSAINLVVLFLVCMLSLQAPMRRGEQRLELDEPIWVVGPSGIISAGRMRDISLSGTGLEADDDRMLSAQVGDRVRVFITEVGFVAGTVVRQTGQFLGVQFSLPVSLERDLLIRKLFTGGLDTTLVSVSAWTATRDMLMSIWAMRTEMLERSAHKLPDVAVASASDSASEKLPAQSIVISPQPRIARLSDVVEQRRSIAA